jgi:hypothetical protein
MTFLILHYTGNLWHRPQRVKGQNKGPRDVPRIRQGLCKLEKELRDPLSVFGVHHGTIFSLLLTETVNLYEVF